MDVIWGFCVLLPWIILSYWAYRFHRLFYFLLVIENTMASMDNILKDSGVAADSLVESKRQKIRNIVAAGQSKIFFGKEYTLAMIDKANDATINKTFEIYESKYSSLVSNSLLERFLDLMGEGVSYVAPIDDSKELSNDYKTDFVLTNELKKVTGQLAYTFGPVLALITGGLITAKHVKWDELREKLNFNNIEDDGRNDAGNADNADSGAGASEAATGEDD